MQLKYVGDLPIISKGGVGFDHTQPDKYKYLQATAELLEALSYGATETTKHLYKAQDKETSSSQLSELLRKHVRNIDEIEKQHEIKADAYIAELIRRVHENETLTDDERVAWLGNIKLMKDYFFQYVVNKSAYEAALDALGDEIHEGKIKEISVPMFKNYGMVLNDLVCVLEKRKAPIDSELKIEEKDGEVIGTLYISHP
jgi:hypothetical protein